MGKVRRHGSVFEMSADRRRAGPRPKFASEPPLHTMPDPRQSLGLLDHVDRTVVVAVIAMRMMKASIDDAIDMILVGNGFLTAVGTMNMPVSVLGMGDIGAPFGIRFGHR